MTDYASQSACKIPDQRGGRYRALSTPPSSAHCRRRRRFPASPSSRVESLTAYYGNSAAVRDMSFQIYQRMVTAIIGPSGCGKSTFIRCLNRMNDVIPSFRTEGRILYNGRRPPGQEHRPGRCAAADRHGLPAAEPVPEVDLREHRVRPADPRPEGRPRRPGREGAAAGRALGRGQGQAQAERAGRSPAGSSSGSASRAAWRSSPM